MNDIRQARFWSDILPNCLNGDMVATNFHLIIQILEIAPMMVIGCMVDLTEGAYFYSGKFLNASQSFFL